MRLAAPRRLGSPVGIATIDLVLLGALFVVSLLPVSFEIARASNPGPVARVAMSWERVNQGALTEGTLPLWNPYQFGGRPHLANPEMLSLYPPHVALRLLPLPLFFSLSFAFHAWVAAVGTYLTARYLALPRLAAVSASGALLSVRLFIPLEEMAYSLDIYRLAWLPLVAACALRSADRQTWLPRPELVVVVALALIASALRPAPLLAAVIASYLFVALWQSPPRGWRHLIAQPVIVVCLAVGLIAIQIVPAVRFWTTMRGDRELLPDVSPRSLADGGSTQQHPEILEAIRSLDPRGRLLSACDRAIDGADVVALDIPGVGGYGGFLLADYARFSNLVRGPQERMRAVFDGIPEAAQGPARMDLLKLLGVEYLVSCTPPDSQRWAVVTKSRGVGLYRSTSAAPRAFWTCAPLAVGREEMEYRLRRGSYDSHMALQPYQIVNVRWPAGMTDSDRSRVESQLHLAPHRDIGDQTWEYNLLDRSRENIAAIVQHPLVEDTQGIDRGTLALLAPTAAIPAFDEPRTQWIMGASGCDALLVPATILSQDHFDGTMTVEVDAPHDGMVFFSETYYPDRRAWVDGRRVARMKVNLAFTGVPVPAGAHRIELQYDTRALWLGTGLTVFTLCAWLWVERRVRRRSAPLPATPSPPAHQ